MSVKILQGDCYKVLRCLPDESVQCCVTSPPYWGLRDYGVEGQLGNEDSPAEFVENMVAVFREVRRVLKDNGTLWLNLGDSYYNYRPGKGQRQSKQSIAGQKFSEVENCNKRGLKIDGLKEKDLVGIPWRVAFALQADGWYLRSDIIWHKPNPMPESVTDRPTKSHEYIFLLTKSKDYYYDCDAIKEPATYALSSGDHRPPGIVRDRLYGYDSKEAVLRGRKVEVHENKARIPHPEGKHGNGQQSPKVLVENRNKRTVWTVCTKPYPEAHFATYPPDLIKPCIIAGCPEGGTVLDPFFGAGTTGLVADQINRSCIGIELNPDYIKIAGTRLESDGGFFVDVEITSPTGATP